MRNPGAYLLRVIGVKAFQTHLTETVLPIVPEGTSEMEGGRQCERKGEGS